MNNLKVLNNQIVLGKQFTVYGDIDNPLFLAKDVAEMIGHSRASEMIKAVDDDEKLMQTILASGQSREMWFLTEYGLYEVLMQSRKPVAKEFKKEVKAILKQLRQCGVVITEQATQEAIDYQSKYGVRRIRKTFRETNDLVGTWNEFKTLSKVERDAHRIDNAERIKCCNIIIDELQDFIANNNLDMKTYEVVMYQEIMLEIQAEAQRLSNKRYGGKISNMTRKINDLEQQLEDVTPYTGAPITLDIHGFTTNNLYTYDSHGERHRSYAYKQWRKKFRTLEIPSKEDYEIYESLDFTQPIGLVINFVAIEAMDADNMVKSFQDALAEHLGLPDDSIFVKCTFEKVAICDTYEDGKITFCMYQL